MLILTRRVGETIRIEDEISVTVLSVTGSQVRIGINAPKDVTVHREEVYRRIQNSWGKPQSSSLNEKTATAKVASGTVVS